uniref:DUF2975 domain-containing protein n=1 Tax=Roseivirga sp. TaxID=1964215 RepID=UPI004047B12E
MKKNKLLIKFCIGILTFARLASVIGVIVMIFIVLTSKADDYLTLEIHRNHSKETIHEGELMPKPEYEHLIAETRLVSVTNNFEVAFQNYLRLPVLIVVTIFMGFSIYLIHLLLQFVKSALNEDFFSYENVARIRLMGFILIGLGVFSSIFKVWLNWISRSYFDSDMMEVASVKVNFTPDVLTNTLFMGLIALIVAQAFDYGLRLKEEQELTI